ncbi:hyaluronan mediated motility receptor-like [Haliotis rufescens]|uniref:hyaluronan mediated motility receptor-like n=1 Tax=Haliotis rufescens TaxID=6454 RepID=UPI00201E8F9B|nr:hyaluronan mediated motility receptor-like [Haliotis rufescens]
MSFSKASLKRFNEVRVCAPPVGAYDPRELKSAHGGAFVKSDRFNIDKEFGPSPADFDISTCSVISGAGVSMLAGNQHGPGVFSSTPRKKSLSHASSTESLKERKGRSLEEAIMQSKLKELEREIKKLLQDKTDLNKQVGTKEEDMKRLEGRLQHAQSDRTALIAKVATLEKDIKDVNKSNSVLKNKVTVTEGTVKKKDDKLQAELTDARNKLEKKDKEISGLKHDMEEAVSLLLRDLREVTCLADKLNNKVSELERSFEDEKDQDSTENAKEQRSTAAGKGDLDLLGKVNKARDDTQKIKLSLHEIRGTAERKVREMKMRMREKYEGAVEKLEQLAEDLQRKDDNLESSKICSEALQTYRDALKSQNKGLQLAVTRLRMEQWECEDTIRSLKGEIFALSDEKEIYEQQSFESNAELATHMEKIEQLEEREEMMNVNIRSLTEKYQMLEQTLAEEQSHHKAEYEKAAAELQVTKASLQEVRVECETSQKTNKDLIQSLNKAKGNTENVTAELDKCKSSLQEIQELVDSQARDVKSKNALLHETQDKIDSLTQQVALKSSHIETLQSRLSETERSESSVSSQLSEVTGSHKKTVELYLERIEKLEEEKAELLEAKHSLLSEVDKLKAEKQDLDVDLEIKEQLLEHLKMQHERDLVREGEKLSELEEKYRESESDVCGKVERLEQQLQIMAVKSEAEGTARERTLTQLEETLEQVKAEKVETVAQLTEYKRNLNMVTEELNAAMEDVAKLAAEKESERQQYEEKLVVLGQEGERERGQWDSVRQDLVQKLEDMQQQANELQELVNRIETEKEMAEHALKEKLRDARNSLTQAQSTLQSSRAELTTELQDTRNTLLKTEKALGSLRADMMEKQGELQGHLVEAEREVTQLREVKNSQQQSLKKLEAEKEALREERDRLSSENLFDTACTSERFAALEEKTSNERKLFEEFKSDLASQLAEAQAENTALSKTFDTYKTTTEADLSSLKGAVKEGEKTKTVVADLQVQVELLQTEKSKLLEDVESIRLSSTQAVGEVRSQLVMAESEVAQLLVVKLEQERRVASLQQQQQAVSEERDRCLSEYNTLAQEVEQMQDQHQQQVEVLRQQFEEQAATADVDALTQEIHKWQTLYQELQEKVAPFMDQIDAFEAERQYLLGCSANAQAEINKLSTEYARLLGHQNQKQKIKHIVRIKEENNTLKKEVMQLREQARKQKRQLDRRSEDRLSQSQCRTKFDPSKAFQHTKENKTPAMSPLKSGNRL